MARGAQHPKSLEQSLPEADLPTARLPRPRFVEDEEPTSSSQHPAVSAAVLDPPLHRMGQSGWVPKAPRTTLSLEATLIDARLSLDLEAVDRLLKGVVYDPSMAARTMRARVQEMGEIAECMNRIHVLSVHDGLASLFDPYTPLSRYLRGVQAWCHGIVRASQQLVFDLRTVPADWSVLKRRVDDASKQHQPSLLDAVSVAINELRGAHPERGPLLDQLTEEVELLMGAVDWFEQSTHLSFGPPAE
jgi:hypothetical protein